MKRLVMIVIVMSMLAACAQEESESQTTPTEYLPPKAGQTLLIEGLQVHEAGQFEEALALFEQAYQRFQSESNTDKMAETLAAKTLTLRRLGRLEDAKQALGQAIRLTEGTSGVVLPLYNLAKVQQEMGDTACVETYQKALEAMEQYQPVPHYRQAVLNDMRLHLAIAQLLFDQDPSNAEANALEAIEALKSDPELDDFGKMVWVSGGYLGLARYYSTRDAERAWSYFDQAEQVIMAYPDETVLRRQDLEALRAEMPTRP